MGLHVLCKTRLFPPMAHGCGRFLSRLCLHPFAPKYQFYRYHSVPGFSSVFKPSRVEQVETYSTIMAMPLSCDSADSVPGGTLASMKDSSWDGEVHKQANG
jgi:hypothetical protein